MQLLQLHEILREADDVLAEAREARKARAATAQVADADLHVMQRHEHGLDHAGGVNVVIELAARGHIVGIAHKRIHVVRGREACDAAQLRVRFDGAQLVGAATAHASVQRRVRAALIRRRAAVPLRNGDRASG